MNDVRFGPDHILIGPEKALLQNKKIQTDMTTKQTGRMRTITMKNCIIRSASCISEVPFFNWLHGVNDSKIESISNQWGSSANTVIPPIFFEKIFASALYCVDWDHTDKNAF